MSLFYYTYQLFSDWHQTTFLLSLAAQLIEIVSYLMWDIRKKQTFHNRRFSKKYLSFINRTIIFQMVWLVISRYLKKHLFYLLVQHQDSIIELQSGKITQLQSELEEMKKSCVKDESSLTQQGN